MATRLRLQTEQVSPQELMDIIKQNWGALGFRPLVQFDRTEGTDNVTVILVINPKSVVSNLNGGKTPVQATESEVAAAYAEIVKTEIENKNPCLQNSALYSYDGELRFVFDLIFVPQYVDPVDIPGPDNVANFRPSRDESLAQLADRAGL